MNKDKHIPQGYKDSPLGIIPKEWEVKRLGDSFTFKQGVQFPVQEQYLEYKTGLIRFIRIVDLTQSDEPPRYVKDPGIQHHISEQDLFMIRYGTPGVIGYGYVGVIANNLFRLIPKQEIDKYYFYQYFKMLEPELMNLSCSSSMAAINFSTLERVYLRYPTSLQEQNRVSNILRTWDTAIEKQSELIEKLKLRKRALMQQLLTGKKRLPGFSGEWKEVKLGDVSTFLRNNTLSREQLNDDDGVINNIHYGDVLVKYPSIIDCRKEKLQYINHGVSILTDYVENGDIIMSDTAEDETVGRVCEVQNVGNKKILAGLHTMLIRPHDKLFAPYYLGYYLNSEAYHKQLIPLIQGIKVCSIGKVAVQNTVLRIPSLEEQRIIASVLVKADKEIELAKEKLANLQSQKRGLMQQLLTGKKRINS